MTSLLKLLLKQVLVYYLACSTHQQLLVSVAKLIRAPSYTAVNILSFVLCWVCGAIFRLRSMNKFPPKTLSFFFFLNGETLRGILDGAVEFCCEPSAVPHCRLQTGMSLPKAACSHRSTKHLVWECAQPGGRETQQGKNCLTFHSRAKGS